MALIELHLPWDQQPQEAVRVSPEFADRCVLLWTPATQDVAQGARETSRTANVLDTVGPAGRSVRFQESGYSQWNLTLNNALGIATSNSVPGTGITVLAWLDRFEVAETTSSTNIVPGLLGLAAGGVVRGVDKGSTATIPTNAPAFIGSFFRSGGGAQVVLYINAVTESYAQLAYTATFPPNGKIGVGNDTGTFRANVNQVAIFSGKLSAEEITRLRLDRWSLFEPRRIRVPVGAGITGTLALSGNSSTASAGLLSAGISKAISGVNATGTLGNLQTAISKIFSGINATGNLGTLAAGVSTLLSGVNATEATGTISVSGLTQTLNGVSSTGNTGTLSTGISKSLGGQSVTGNIGTLLSGTSKGLGGVSGTSNTGILGTGLGLSGISVSGNTGNVSVVISKALLGSNATGATGTVTPLTGTVVTVKAGSWLRYRTI